MHGRTGTVRPYNVARLPNRIIFSRRVRRNKSSILILQHRPKNSSSVFHIIPLSKSENQLSRYIFPFNYFFYRFRFFAKTKIRISCYFHNHLTTYL